MRLVICCLSLLALSGPALGQQQASYLDDRSTPAALVKSLYNAINRREFARAFSYFANPPSADVAAYAAGYEDTESVEVVAGAPSEEGAAGSLFYQLPIAIQATATDGSQRVFAGCYTLRLVNPALQAETFTPLTIERGSLRPSDEELNRAIPTQCGDGPELPANDVALERAKAVHAAAAVPICETDPAAMGEQDREPQTYSLSFRYDYESDEDPEHLVRLFRFFCYRGAYNESHIYYLADEDGEVEQLQFARPELVIRYEDDDSEKAVESIRIDGYSARADLVNSEFDPDTQTIWEYSKWRGIGDASSAAHWAFRHGKFRLVFFQVDASYDGELEAETIVDYETAP
jgi:hypothetical protein